jgi:hypothetical protein
MNLLPFYARRVSQYISSLAVECSLELIVNLRRRLLIQIVSFVAVLGLTACPEPCPMGTVRGITSYDSGPALYDELVVENGQAICYSTSGWLPFERREGQEGQIFYPLVGNDQGYYRTIYPSNIIDVKLILTTVGCTNEGAYWARATPDGQLLAASIRAMEPIRSNSGIGNNGTGYERPNSFFAGEPGATVLCVVNDSGARLTVGVQMFFPQTECREASAFPRYPALKGIRNREVCNVTEPPPPVVIPPPMPIPTCSGQAPTSAGYYDVLVQAPSGCADRVNWYANNLEEAKMCARQAGLGPVSQVCQYEVLIESSPAPYTEYPYAMNASNAIACARNSYCSSCSPQVIAQGECVYQ